MNILAIESSCDETAAAVLRTGPNFPAQPDYALLSNVVVSQIDIFKAYGGVIPEVAARSHLEAVLPVIHQALADANCTWADITHIAVTHTPGLLGSLLIGTLTARTLAILHDKPLYPVHHLKSHIYSAFFNNSLPNFPIISLVISGGHTQIIYMPTPNDFQIIGTTRDDAVGECFDKVAKILGLPYPGGPAISQAAKKGDENKYKFPHPILKKTDGTQSLDFSFSGLKTAVLRTVQKELNLPINHPSSDLKNHLTKKQIADFAASFQKTAIDILLEKLSLATSQYNCNSIVIAGGVSANKKLRERVLEKKSNSSLSGLAEVTTEQERPSPVTTTPWDAEGEAKPKPTGARDATANEDIRLLLPDFSFSGDNAAMVALAAAYEIASGKQPHDPYHLDILPRSPIA